MARGSVKFGRLHTGDIITRMHNIRFRCEFFYGVGLRPTTTAFTVESYAVDKSKQSFAAK